MLSDSKRGPGRWHRRGFTLIELLIVVILLGILTTIAVLQIRSAREQAWMASLHHDMRTLALHQELYFQQNQAYAPLLDLPDVRPSEDVTLTINWLGPGGFAATASHGSMSTAECGFFVGSAPAGTAGPATTETTLTCTP